MMKITSIPKDVAVELLLYLSENEDFSNVARELKGSVSVTDVRTLLKEIAVGLSREDVVETALEADSVLGGRALSEKAKKVLEALPKKEFKTLLSALENVSE